MLNTTRLGGRLWATAAVLALAIAAADSMAETIAAGAYHGLWVKDDGSLLAWGFNEGGQVDSSYIDRSFPVPVVGLTHVKVAAGGYYHSLAAKTDGTVWAWGSNAEGQLGDGTNSSRVSPVQITSISGVLAAVAGTYHSLALKTDGTVWAWGRNSSGQLGDGTNTGRNAPSRVAGLTGVISIAAGRYHSLALKSDGTVWAWGGNGNGQLGDGTKTSRNVPVQVAGLAGIVGISTTRSHSVALKFDGTVWTWGWNYYGQLGDGTITDRTLPIKVAMPAGVVQAVAGGFATYARRSDGTAVAWGDNFYGQLGDGSTTERHLPVAMQGVTGAAHIAAGWGHAGILRTDGSLWSVGQNYNGQLADSSLVYAPAPVPLTGATAITRLAPGHKHSLALRADGTVVAWGANDWGQLGDGTWDSRSAPTPVPGLTNMVAVAAGSGFSIALKSDGTVWSWGYNYYGELGDPSVTESRASPGQIPGLTGVVAIAAGLDHVLALKSNGSLWSWGSNIYGQLGDGTFVNHGVPTLVAAVTSPAAIAAGGYHTMILRSDGTVASWGRNDYGQLGDGSSTNRATPVTATGLSGIQAIAGGTWHSLALKAGGTVWGWGYNGNGNLGTGTYTRSSTPVQAIGANSVVAITAGGRQSMALTGAGTVLAWGAAGKVGDGTDRDALYPTALAFIGPVDRIAAGFDFTLVVTRSGATMGWGSNYSQKIGIAFATKNPLIVKARDPLASYAGSDLVVEYFNPTIKNGAGTSGVGHYFITADPAEAMSIDSGGSGPGWQRTGRTFRAWTDKARAPAGAVPVYRFYARVPNSHFYTASLAEYQSLRAQNPSNNANLGWSFESIAFHTVLPQGTACAAGYYPVYRVYNQRFSPNPTLNDGNHRITPSRIDWTRSVFFLGYADEGIAFCSPVSSDANADLHAWYIYPGLERQSGDTLEALFIFTNNGPGAGNGGRVYVSLPPEVANWTVTCSVSAGTSCPGSTTDLTALRSGLAIGNWPAGGIIVLAAAGTAPPVTTGGNSTLRFGALATAGAGAPDANRANNVPAMAKTLVNAPQACNYVVNPATLSLGPAAQPVQLSVLSGVNCPWTIQNTVTWLSATTGGAQGNGIVTLTPQANTATGSRSGTIVVAGHAIVVTQAGTPPVANSCATIRLQRDGDQMSAAGLSGEGSVAITADSLCTWSSQSSTPWLSVTAGGTGTGNGTLRYVVQPNPTSQVRIGSINTEGKLFTVTQQGRDPSDPGGQGDSGGDNSGGGGGDSGSGGGDSGGGSGGDSG